MRGASLFSSSLTWYSRRSTDIKVPSLHQKEYIFQSKLTITTSNIRSGMLLNFQSLFMSCAWATVPGQSFTCAIPQYTKKLKIHAAEHNVNNVTRKSTRHNKQFSLCRIRHNWYAIKEPVLVPDCTVVHENSEYQKFALQCGLLLF